MTAPQNSALLCLPNEALDHILDLASCVELPEPRNQLGRASPTGAPARGSWRVLPLILICRRLHWLAIPLLYRYVSLCDIESARKYMDTVYAHRHLGKYLLTLDLIGAPHGNKLYGPMHLLNLLPSTPNLKELLLGVSMCDESLFQALGKHVPGLHSLVLIACPLDLRLDPMKEGFGIKDYFERCGLVNFHSLKFLLVGVFSKAKEKTRYLTSSL